MSGDARAFGGLDELQARYRDVWARFTGELVTFQQELERLAATGDPGDLHELLQRIHWVPYIDVRPVVHAIKADATADNIGSVTGLFFEQIVTAVAVGYVRARIPSVRIERHKATTSRIRQRVRAPDLLFVNRDRGVVVEMKATVRRHHLQQLLRLRSELAEIDIELCVVAGHLATNADALESLGTEPWFCFLAVSKANQSKGVLDETPRVDAVLDHIVDNLG